MKTAKILLVEDNEDDVALMLRAFKINKIPNEVVIARNGVEALDLLMGEKTIQPCLVILDLKLPKVNGLQVLQSIRENVNTRNYPIIILTTSVEQEDVIKSYELGANSYIRKPVEFEKFSKAVEQLGLYWLFLNEPNPKYHERR
ncbi:MAG: response regulator [Cyclobacteriaceae bacterium]|nr:response regulator [Cyclobacteriaceae bacterium]